MKVKASYGWWEAAKDAWLAEDSARWTRGRSIVFYQCHDWRDGEQRYRLGYVPSTGEVFAVGLHSPVMPVEVLGTVPAVVVVLCGDGDFGFRDPGGNDAAAEALVSSVCCSLSAWGDEHAADGLRWVRNRPALCSDLLDLGVVDVYTIPPSYSQPETNPSGQWLEIPGNLDGLPF